MAFHFYILVKLLKFGCQSLDFLVSQLFFTSITFSFWKPYNFNVGFVQVTWKTIGIVWSIWLNV